MTATREEAFDQINALFLEAWDANAGAVAGYIPEVRWHGNEKDTKPDASRFWVRHSIMGVGDEQIVMSPCVGKPGQRLYEATGLIFIQIFCPKSIKNSLILGGRLATIAQNAYRGKTTEGAVWFRNVRVNDIPNEREYYRLNVVAEYEYDELQ